MSAGALNVKLSQELSAHSTLANIWLNPRLIGENRRLMPAVYGTSGFAPSPLSWPIARLFHCKAAIAVEGRRVRTARALRAAAVPEDLVSPAAHRRPS